MPVSISLYNHTLKRFAAGENVAGDSYLVNLYTAATFDATATTKAAAESGATQVSTANGYTQNAMTLSNVVIEVVDTNDARFKADTTEWTASGGSITASYAIVYNDTDANDPPVAFINFDGSQSAGDGTKFRLVWNATNGIVKWTI